MMLDAMSERQEKAFRGRVDEFLLRCEKRYRLEKLARVNAVSDALDRQIAHLLDGDAADPRYVSAYQDADELQAASLSLARSWRQGLDRVITYKRKGDKERWSADFGDIRKALDVGKTNEKPFFFDLAVAEASVSIGQKAIVAYAADTALRDPDNAYPHLRQALEARGQRVVELEDLLTSVITDLKRVKLVGSGWGHDSDLQHQKHIGKMLQGRPIAVEQARPVTLLRRPDGQLLQIEEAVAAGV